MTTFNMVRIESGWMPRPLQDCGRGIKGEEGRDMELTALKKCLTRCDRMVRNWLSLDSKISWIISGNTSSHSVTCKRPPPLKATPTSTLRVP